MAVRDFSSLYPEYQVEFVDYEVQYGEQADQQLLMDLLYGQSPDLLFVNGLPYEVYARQGLLEDLYPWIDADETLSRTDFTQNLLRALETNGALYRLPQTYLLETAMGLPETVGGEAGWTMAEFLDTVQAHPALTAVFAQEDGASMLQQLLLHAPEAFVDYEAAEAHFDSPDFLRLLALAQRQTVPEAESVREALLTGQVLLEPLTIMHAQDFDEEYADSLNQFSFPGFPGAGRAVFYPNLPMAIPVSAQEKEGAWAFLKLLITEDRYAARGRGGWLPLQADFEEKTAAMQDPDAEKTPACPAGVGDVRVLLRRCHQPDPRRRAPILPLRRPDCRPDLYPHPAPRPALSGGNLSLNTSTRVGSGHAQTKRTRAPGLSLPGSTAKAADTSSSYKKELPAASCPQPFPEGLAQHHTVLSLTG